MSILNFLTPYKDWFLENIATNIFSWIFLAVFGWIVWLCRQALGRIWRWLIPNTQLAKPNRDVLHVGWNAHKISFFQNVQRYLLTKVGLWFALFSAYIFYTAPRLNYEVKNDFSSSDEESYAVMRETVVFFSERFGDSFPGIRYDTEFIGASNIAHRLNIFFRRPMFYESEDTRRGIRPFWWYAGMHGNMHISRWCRLKPDIFLLDRLELNIRKIVAHPGQVYWQNCIYVECGDLAPSSVYDQDVGYVERQRRDFGYASEEFAVYKFRLYSRAEYDDAGYVRNGIVRQFAHIPDLRKRILTPFNFILAAPGSPISRSPTDQELSLHLDSILAGHSDTEALFAWYNRLPRLH